MGRTTGSAAAATVGERIQTEGLAIEPAAVSIPPPATHCEPAARAMSACPPTAAEKQNRFWATSYIAAFENCRGSWLGLRMPSTYLMSPIETDICTLND